MVKDSQDTSIFESFTEARKAVRERKIVEKAMKILDESDGEKTRDEISEMLGISSGKLSDAFAKEKERSNPLLEFTKKAGLGLGGLGLLSNIDKIQDISGKFVSDLLDNKVATGLTVGLATFWQTFVKPKVNAPENQLSELEVFVELMQSTVGQTVVGALISSITLPGLLSWIQENVLTKVFDIASNWNEFVAGAYDKATEESEDILERNFGVDTGDEGNIYYSDNGQKLVILDVRKVVAQNYLAPEGFDDQKFSFTASGQKFPSYEEWYDSQNTFFKIRYLKNSSVAKNLYAFDRNEFIREFAITEEEWLNSQTRRAELSEKEAFTNAAAIIRTDNYITVRRLNDLGFSNAEQVCRNNLGGYFDKNGQRCWKDFTTYQVETGVVE